MTATTTSKFPSRPSLSREEYRAREDEWRYPWFLRYTYPFLILNIVMDVFFVGVFGISMWLLMSVTMAWLAWSTIALIVAFTRSGSTYRGHANLKLDDETSRRYKIPVMAYCWPAVLGRSLFNWNTWEELPTWRPKNWNVQTVQATAVDTRSPVHSELAEAKKIFAELHRLIDTSGGRHIEELAVAYKQAQQTINDLEQVEIQIADDAARIKSARLFDELQILQGKATDALQIQKELMDEYHNPQLALRQENHPTPDITISR